MWTTELLPYLQIAEDLIPCLKDAECLVLQNAKLNAGEEKKKKHSRFWGMITAKRKLQDTVSCRQNDRFTEFGCKVPGPF